MEPDQSATSGADFRASDLQFCTATAENTASPSFTMKHKMGLSVFSIQDKDVVTQKKYLDKSANTYTYVWTENTTIVKVHSSRTFSSNPKPFTGTGNMYYYIVKSNTDTNITATNDNTLYPNSDAPDNGWTENVNIPSNGYTLYSKTPDMTCSVMTKHTLAKGDILYPNGVISSSVNASKYGTPIGIVFYTSTTSKDKTVDADLTHGYAMALKWAGGGNTLADVSTWCTGTYQTAVATEGLLTPRSNNGMGDIVTTGLLQSGETEEQYRIRAIKTDMDGLTHCRTAKGRSGGATSMTAILKAESHSSYAPVPTSSTTTTSGTITLKSPKTSGWYLPSIGQCYQWLAMCSTVNSRTITFRPNGSGTDKTKDFSYQGQCVAVTNEVNDYFKNKGLTSYSVTYPTTGWWWHSSTENFSNATIIMNLDGSHVYFDGRQGYGDKNNPGGTSHPTGVWSVLAF